MNFLSKNLHEDKAEIKLYKEIFKDFLILIYPFTPHIASECWEKNFENQKIHTSTWPKFDEKIIKEEKINIVVQINGKKRTMLITETDQDQEIIFKKCLEIESVKKLLAGKHVVKKIYVKNKLVNIVI